MKTRDKIEELEKLIQQQKINKAYEKFNKRNCLIAVRLEKARRGLDR